MVPLLMQGRVNISGNEMEKRDQFRAGVMRNANPYTMTVEQWGDIEMERAAEQQFEQVKAKVEKEAAESLLSAEDKEERARLKADNWDSYTEMNPKGAGNRNDNYFRR